MQCEENLCSVKAIFLLSPPVGRIARKEIRKTSMMHQHTIRYTQYDIALQQNFPAAVYQALSLIIPISLLFSLSRFGQSSRLPKKSACRP